MTYASATILVLSGTGNSLRAARWMAEAAAASGASVQLHRIEAGPQPRSAGGAEHLVGLFLPTHGFTAPWAMLRYAARLPRAHGDHAFVLATRAGVKLGPVFVPGMEGTAGYLLALILLLKGYSIRGVSGLDMPSNWTALHSGMKPASVTAIIERARPVADRVFARVLGGGRCFRGLLCLALGLALAPLSLAYLLAGRFFLAKLFFANRRCNGCGLCAQRCPLGGVRMWRGRPYWTFSCESCMRCMGFCSRQAVEAGHSWAVLLSMIATASFSGWLLEQAKPLLPAIATIDSPPLRMAIDYGYLLVSLFLGYLAFWWLIRLPAINALFTWTTLTHFFRRYHEPETTPRDLEPPRER